MKKKKYFEPEAELLKFSEVDILTSSTGNDYGVDVPADEDRDWYDPTQVSQYTRYN